MAKQKKCFKCEKTKTIDDFYKHPRMADGHFNKCKECSKKDSNIHYHNKMEDDDFVSKERLRSRKRSRERERNYTKKQRKKWRLNYREKYPEKYLAKLSCQQMERKKEEIHHWSYNEEDLHDVIHLTTNDHKIAHVYLIYDQERMMYRTVDGVLLNTKEKHVEYIKEKIKSDPFYK